MKENPKHIRISEYNYPLPDERIAKFPLPMRDQSKLLIYRHGEVSEDVFTSLPEHLPAGSLMIFPESFPLYSIGIPEPARHRGALCRK